jgi:hypothetical protein
MGRIDQMYEIIDEMHLRGMSFRNEKSLANIYAKLLCVACRGTGSSPFPGL